MANFLTFNGTPIPILRDGAKKRPPARVGDSARAYDGTLRSTVSAVKREWDVKTGPLLAADEAAIRAIINADAEVTVAGDAIGGSLTCMVEDNGSDYISDGTTDGFLFLASFTIREV